MIAKNKWKVNILNTNIGDKENKLQSVDKKEKESSDFSVLFLNK